MRIAGDRIVIATRNAGKAREFARLFEPLGMRVATLLDLEGIPEIVEDGDSFAANAAKKARTVGDALGIPVAADDSGICVDLLGGAPGIYSARYAGEGAGDVDNLRKLLAELSRVAEPVDVEGRATLSPAHFMCALAVYDPAEGGRFLHAAGRCDGYVVPEPVGTGGFGYDPVFYVPEYRRTMAELTPEEKNAVGHRGRAMRELARLLSLS